MDQYQITLKDGRTVIFEEASEEAAIRAAERWQSLNPKGQPINYYEVTLENGQTTRVPAVSEEAAGAFTQAWGPQQRARAASERSYDSGIPGTEYGATENAVNATTLGLDKVLNAGVDAISTGIQNMVGEGPGYGMADAFNASREVQNDLQREYQAENPVTGFLSGLAGGAAMPGATQLGNFAVRGIGGASTGAQALRAAGVGAGVGGVSGLLNSDPGDELGGAARGAIVGGGTAGAFPVAARAASGAARTFGGGARQALNAATGGNVPGLRGGGADRQAMLRLGESLRADGIGEQEIRDTLNEAMRRGIGDNLLDVIGPNATRTRALIQGAAMKPGPAQTLASQYRNETATALQDRAIGRAQQLTPDNNMTAQQYQGAIDDTRAQLAEVDYGPAYQQQVPVDARVTDALDGIGGDLRQALRTAEIRRDPQRIAELNALMSDDLPSEVSAATLDRIQRRLGQSGRNLTRSLENADPETASGYFSRQADLNAVLDSVPELAPARATYRGYSTASGATKLGQNALRPTTRPADYADELARLQGISDESSRIAGNPLPTAQQGAQVGVRDAVVNRIGNMGEGSTGFLNTLQSAPNATQVLETTYGQAARPFQQDIGALVQGLQNARFIDPSTGSQTASRLAAEELVSDVPTTLRGGLLALINKIRRGATLTDAERESIVRLSTQRLSPNGIPVPPQRTPTVSSRFAPLLGGAGG